MDKYDKLLNTTYAIGDCLLEEDFVEDEFNELIDLYTEFQQKILELGYKSIKKSTMRSNELDRLTELLTNDV